MDDVFDELYIGKIGELVKIRNCKKLRVQRA